MSWGEVAAKADVWESDDSLSESASASPRHECARWGDVAAARDDDPFAESPSPGSSSRSDDNGRSSDAHSDRNRPSAPSASADPHPDGAAPADSGPQGDVPVEQLPGAAVALVEANQHVVGAKLVRGKVALKAVMQPLVNICRHVIAAMRMPAMAAIDETGFTASHFNQREQQALQRSLSVLQDPNHSLPLALYMGAAISDDNAQRTDIHEAKHLRIAADVFEGSSKISTQALQASLRDVSGPTLASVQRHTSCAAILLERDSAIRMLKNFVHAVENSGGRLVCFVEHPRYDETKMHSRVREAFSNMVRATEAGKGLQTSSHDLPLVKVADSQAGPNKLLNTEWKYGALANVGGRYVSVLFRTVQWLQVMGRTTAEVYVDCLSQSRLPTDDIANKFKMSCRVAVNDSDSAVTRAERAHEHAGKMQMSLALKCAVHKAAHIREHTLGMEKKFISQIGSFVLTLREGNSLRLFRDAVRKVVSDPAFVIYDVESYPVIERKTELVSLLDTFMPENIHGNRNRRAVLLSLANGGIVGKQIIHYERVCSTCQSRKDCMEKFRASFVAAVLPTVPRSFPGRNWINNEDACDCIGLLAGLNILRPAMALFAKSLDVTVPRDFEQFGIQDRASGGDRGDAHPRDTSNHGELVVFQHDEHPAPEVGIRASFPCA